MPRTNIHGIQGATSETARGINREIVLNLIRRRQPISRAGLRVNERQRGRAMNEKNEVDSLRLPKRGLRALVWPRSAVLGGIRPK
jgi:hypothetical protein